MVLDLRSCERASLAIPFFDQHIPGRAARVIEAEVVNRLFSADEAQTTPEQIFDRQQTPACDPEASAREIAELTAHVPDPNERFRLASEFMASRARQPLPEVERFPVHFYDDGIGQFTTSLTMRQVIAFQHWQGNRDYSMYDVIQEMVQRGE